MPGFYPTAPPDAAPRRIRETREIHRQGATLDSIQKRVRDALPGEAFLPGTEEVDADTPLSDWYETWPTDNTPPAPPKQEIEEKSGDSDEADNASPENEKSTPEGETTP